MRKPLDAERLKRFLERLGELSRGPGRIYLVGGCTAVSEGWRDSTIDVDLALDPEPEGVFEAIRYLKEELDLNVELASPADFIPALPKWRERSRSVGRFGQVDVFHYDAYSQALAKIERGHQQDLSDVEHMFARGLISAGELRLLFEAIEPELIRYPSIQPDAFRSKVGEAIERAAVKQGG